MEREKEHLIEARTEFRSLAAQFPEKFEGPPRNWFRPMARFIVGLEQTLPVLPPETQAFTKPLAEEGRKILQGEVDFGKTISPASLSDEAIGLRVESHLMNTSRELALPFEPEVRGVAENLVSLDELLQKCPDQLRMTTTQRGETAFHLFGVRHPTTQEWYDFPMPMSDSMWHKGGVARMVLDVFAGSPSSMIAAEIPVNDYDVVFVGDEAEARMQAKQMGVDPDGVEVAGEEVFDFTKFCYGRDTTQNQVCFGIDGLHFSDQALESARTGHVEIIGQYIANKAIYGVDQFRHHGEELVKPRGLMRLVKAVSEGKALSFSYKPMNDNLDIGLYWIFLAKKWHKRADFGILMQRMYELGQRMNQTNHEENSITDVLERAHRDFPFFDIDKRINDIVDVVRWKTRKFAKQLDREYSWTYNIPTNALYPRRPNDTIPQRVGLDGFVPSAEEARRIASWWPVFSDTCRERTALYNRLGINPVERMFYDVDTEFPYELTEE